MDLRETFLPPDRRRALARGERLPDRAMGAVLFADVSGFTPLTEAMTRSLGARRGAENITGQLNRVYDALIDEIENYNGSVIGFAGDAALSWFSEDPDEPSAAARAVTCAFALQRAMQQFSAVALPDGTTTSLAIKVTVAYGMVRRFAIGDPDIRRIDALAGSTVARTATAEHLAHPGEVLVDEPTLVALAGGVDILEWRTDDTAAESFAVVTGLHETIPPRPVPPTPPLDETILKPWLHAPVYERIRTEGAPFLAELRPVAALFARFHGIDFDSDEQAGDKLDRFIQRVQQVLRGYDGALLELTIGDKGSYFYATFGAPHVHEDDARRAVLAARELLLLCRELGFIDSLQIGISQGVMRVGAYGSGTRTMYGAQGDEVNLAARLMIEAPPGSVLVSGAIQKAISQEFDLQPLPPIRLKGKAEPLLPFVVQGMRETRVQQLQEAYYTLPMIGREDQVALLQEKLALARRGQGQVIGITARAGMGKSRLTAEIIRAVRRHNESSYGGECQSFGTNMSYLVWAPVLRAFFGLDANLPLRRQIRVLESELEELAPERVEALPLLGTVLNLAIPENDFTRDLEPEFRKSALRALLLDCVRAAAEEARAEGQTLLFIIEDAHWIDPASRELLTEIASNIQTLPVVLLLNYRPPEVEGDRSHDLYGLPHFTEIVLTELTPQQGEGLIRAKLAQHAPESKSPIPAELIARITTQAQGNPFYIEQILDYIHDRGINFREAGAAEIDLPNTLHRLVLSRIDQLNEQQQLTLKAASIIGRWFSIAHLCGYFPRIGSPEQVLQDLALMRQYDLTALDTPEPEITYLFKHVVTHQVAYQALAYATRAMLHEEYARYLETHQDPVRALDLIAFHYDHSENLPKRLEYLRRAGQAAAARFANVEALDYLTRALALTSETDGLARYDLLCARERIFDVQGERELQNKDLTLLEHIAPTLDDDEKQLDVWLKQALLAERMTNHARASEILERITEKLTRASLAPNARMQIETEAALVSGVVLWQQGTAALAQPRFERALELARQTGNRVEEARALSFLGTVCRELGKYELAQSFYQAQMATAHEIGDRRSEWSALNNLGLISDARGDALAASRTLTEALRLARELGDRLGEGLLLRNLGLASMNLGAYDQAIDYANQAVAAAAAIGDLRNVNAINLLLGETFRLVGDYPTAKRYTEHTLEKGRDLGDRLIENFALMNLSAIALAQGDLESARGLNEHAIPLAREIGHRDGEGFLLNTLGQIQLASGEIDEAYATFSAAVLVWAALEPLVESLGAYAGLAEAALHYNESESARVHAETILNYLDTHPEQRGAPAALAAALTVYHVLDRQDDPRALDVLASAYQELKSRSEKITDESRRRSFLENVPANAALARAAMLKSKGIL